MNLVDFHNHLMPGVDDGARTAEDTEAALRQFKAQGVETVIATPHLEASLATRPERMAHRLAELDQGFAALKQAAEKVGGMQVGRAVELLLDLPEPDISDARMRLNGGKFFLMEFPFMSVPPHSERAIQMLVRTGYVPIVAHPERYRHVRYQLNVLERWKADGAYLQLNAGSLLGRYGKEARAAALELLARGWADYICSDYHARGVPATAECRRLLEASDAAEQALILMQTNPARMLKDEPPIPVAPVRIKTSLWERLSSLLRK